MRLVNRWMKDNVKSETDFCCTSISVNMDYAAKLHRDSNNCGPSVCKAVGDFEGGRLGYFADDDNTIELPRLKADHKKDAVYLDVQSDFQLFDGNRAHWVEPFEGERLSFVFFCVSKY